MKNALIPILDGRAALEPEKMSHRYWVCRPDGERLQRKATEEDALACAERLLAKGAL